MADDPKDEAEVERLTKPTLVNCLQCPLCCDILFSRSQHDMRFCSCGALAVDGGPALEKISGDVTVVRMVKSFALFLPQTPRELHTDYALRRDAYGLIKLPRLKTRTKSKIKR